MLPRLALVVASALLVVGCVTVPDAPPGGGDGAADPVTVFDGDAITHVAGDNASGAIASGVAAVMRAIGHDAAEPTFAFASDGTIFYAAATFDSGLPFPRGDVLRSKDGGVTWEDVSPRFPGGAVQSPPVTGDPMVYVDPATDRVFNIDQTGVACYYLSTSDDLGDSWNPANPAACVNPPADHQTIVAAKPRTLPTTLYESVVLVCYNQIATSECIRSVDGGVTFQKTGPVGTLGADPDAGDPTNPEDPRWLCSALVGHLAAAPDGTVYLPRRECATPMVAVTEDDGVTWRLSVVSQDVPAFHGGGTIGADPAVAVDREGNVYFAWQGADGHAWLATSADKGATWSKPKDVTAPGLTVTHFPTLAAGDAGRVALAYVGSSVPGGYAADEEAMANATWHGFLAVIPDALADAPTITTARVTPADDPLVRGPCGPGRCPGIFDFIDAQVDPWGRPWAAFVDACSAECASAEDGENDLADGVIVALVSGPGLLAGQDALAALPAEA